MLLEPIPLVLILTSPVVPLWSTGGPGWGRAVPQALSTGLTSTQIAVPSNPGHCSWLSIWCQVPLGPSPAFTSAGPLWTGLSDGILTHFSSWAIRNVIICLKTSSHLIMGKLYFVLLKKNVAKDVIQLANSFTVSSGELLCLPLSAESGVSLFQWYNPL